MTADDAAALLAHLDVSRETLPALTTLAGLLERWSPRINLVAKSTLSDIWGRHIVDSAQLWPLTPPAAHRWADMGSGAGFPGLVIAAIAAQRRPDLSMTLIESDGRKCAFLAEASRAMGLSPVILNRRIEAAPEAAFDVVSARALASLTHLLDLAGPRLVRTGVCLVLKGQGWRDELTASRQSWHTVCGVTPSLTNPAGAVLRLTEIRRADS